MLPDLEERKSRIVGFFANHLVALVASSDRWNGPNVATTFVLSVADQWFLVTAGHVMRGLFEDVAKLPPDSVRYKLIDSGGLNATHFTPVPFALEDSPTFVLGDDSDYDYAAIAISPLYRRLLEANGIRALDEETWRKQPCSEPDYYVLLGIPKELVMPEPGFGVPKLACSLHTLKYRSRQPNGFKVKKGPRLYFDVSLGSEVTSLVGMSGGPVFALRQDANGALRYWLAGVQSSWVPTSKITAVCPALLLGESLLATMYAPDEVVDQLLALQQEIQILRQELDLSQDIKPPRGG